MDVFCLEAMKLFVNTDKFLGALSDKSSYISIFYVCSQYFLMSGMSAVDSATVQPLLMGDPPYEPTPPFPPESVKMAGGRAT